MNSILMGDRERRIGTFPGRLDNVYIDAAARSTEEVERFAAELENDMLNGNKFTDRVKGGGRRG